jgi:hypothetical protein
MGGCSRKAWPPATCHRSRLIGRVTLRAASHPKGRVLGIVLGSVGKSKLEKAFGNTVKAIEARNAGATATEPTEAP